MKTEIEVDTKPRVKCVLTLDGQEALFLLAALGTKPFKDLHCDVKEYVENLEPADPALQALFKTPSELAIRSFFQDLCYKLNLIFKSGPKQSSSDLKLS